MQIIVFKINGKDYAINTNIVEEISREISSTMVPNAPEWVEGIINLRGDVITLLNLSKLLHQENSLCYNNIIIIQNNDEKVGLMVDEVVQVMDIEDKDIQKMSKTAHDSIVGIAHIDHMIINIIDIEILLSKNEGSI